MSDFLFSTRRRADGDLLRTLERWLGPVAAETREYHGTWGSLAVLAASHAADPVHEDERSLSLLVGEPLAGPAASTSGHRAAVHRRLAAGATDGWDEWLDGPFAAISVDRATGRGMAVTDVFGWIPLFAAAPAGPASHLVVGTHVDAVAEAAGVRGEPDPVSAVELMGYFTVSAPHTLYPSVRQLWAGSSRRFSAFGWDGAERPYWLPLERAGFASLGEAAHALRGALVADVERAVEGHSRVGMLLSGGEDARVVLGALPAGVAVQGFIYTEEEGREVRSARRVARAYGADVHFEHRPPGHDLRHFPAVAAMIGTQNECIDVHGYALHASMGIDRLPVVLGGFSADALLKADNVSRAARKRILSGRSAGVRAAQPPDLPGVRPELLRAAAARRDGLRLRLAELRPESAEEWSHVYPFTMRKYAAGFHGNRRLFRSHEPFMCNAVVRIAASVPQMWKLHRRLVHAAFRPLLAPSWYVPHARNRLPYFPHGVNVVARPFLGLARGVRSLAAGTMGVNQESWPVWQDLVRTPAMAARLRESPLAESPLRAVLADPDAAGVPERWAPLRQLMALQLAYLTRL